MSLSPSGAQGIIFLAQNSLINIILRQSHEAWSTSFWSYFFSLQDEFSLEHEVDIEGSKLQYHLTDLREFTEYSFHVSAFNENGEGGYSEEVTTRTYSDIPADPPQNVTLEPASSSSVIGKIYIFCESFFSSFFCSSSMGAASQGVSKRSADGI